MQEIKEVAEKVNNKIQYNDLAKDDLMVLAQKIAHVSLEVFKGELLRKALMIAECLVDFEDAYWNQ